MKLQTQVPIPKETIHPIDYDSRLLLLGSCFSENIGNQLAFYKFQSLQNPFGILFHPAAIEQVITNAINQKVYTKSDLFFLNERWHCFEAHSSISATSEAQILQTLNHQIKATYEQLHQASHIVITLGTAWAYRHIETDSLVANCHKVPQKKFQKELLSIPEIVAHLEAIISLIRSINKNTTFVFTVSPVRHLKDGFIENQQSKSHLIAAVRQLITPRKRIQYFPSYEIMMDELRDYRFYKEDMIHPNKTAIRYIWEQFCTSWVTAEAQQTMKEVLTIQNGLQHRPFVPHSEQHQQFLTQLNSKIKRIQKQYPFMKF